MAQKYANDKYAHTVGLSCDVFHANVKKDGIEYEVAGLVSASRGANQMSTAEYYALWAFAWVLLDAREIATSQVFE